MSVAAYPPAVKTCPSCGAPSGGTSCVYCGRSLQNAPEAHSPSDRQHGLECPRCGSGNSLVTTAIGGGIEADACAACSGLWLDTGELNAVVQAERAVAAARPPIQRMKAPPPLPVPMEVKYIPCPRCGQLMNRQNFEQVSGIVLDECAAHGTWLDGGELKAVLQFIASGGLERADRQREVRGQETLDEKKHEALRRVVVTSGDAYGGRYAGFGTASPGLAASAIGLLARVLMTRSRF